MEQQLCRLCHTRHALGEPHRWPDGPIAVADQTPIKAKVEIKPIARVPVPKKTAVPIIPTAADPYYGCPACAERKRKHAARVKRWREKRGSGR